jgi:glycine/D-amino acid oxidase-like deaminating enzyme
MAPVPGSGEELIGGIGQRHTPGTFRRLRLAIQFLHDAVHAVLSLFPVRFTERLPEFFAGNRPINPDGALATPVFSAFIFVRASPLVSPKGL